MIIRYLDPWGKALKRVMGFVGEGLDLGAKVWDLTSRVQEH